MSEWIAKSGKPVKSFFNTSGKLYKEFNLKERLSEMSFDEQLDILSSDGMMVKRPILAGETIVLVGFNEEEWKNNIKK